MYEVIALVLGAMLGVALHRLETRLRIPLLVVASIAIGVLVATVSGELAIAWEFVLFDVGQVVLAALAAAALARRVARPSPQA